MHIVSGAQNIVKENELYHLLYKVDNARQDGSCQFPTLVEPEPLGGEAPDITLNNSA